jgi:hypothetical protein
MRKFVMFAILAMVAVFGASSVSAQGSVTPNSEFYVGYQLVNSDVSVRDSAHGFNVSGTSYFKPTSPAGLTAEVGANFKNDESLATAMGGLTLKARNNTVQPFVRGLLGVSRSSVGNAEYGFSFVAGGGLDVKVGDTVSLRLVQADYLQTRLFGARQDNFRLGAGIVF